MVTTTCQELAGIRCSVPISGQSLEELRQNVVAHAQTDHKGQFDKMSPREQGKLMQRIEEVYQQKSGVPMAR